MRPSLLSAALFCAALPATAADLAVDVVDVKDAEGSVRIAVYGESDPWLAKPLKATNVKAAPGTVRASFHDLPEGDYAVVIYHDRNGNRKLDTNFLGMPKEPWGFSNDATGRMGPPDFKDARFTVPAGGTRITIHLQDPF
jgi:uncharacterized protein (DUF2141 family)